jgi:hypothetical protein
LEKQQQQQQFSMKLIASLAQARAEIKAGVVAKADQKQTLLLQRYKTDLSDK